MLNMKQAAILAVHEDDLDAAARLIQDAVGQTDGGVAGDYFSCLDNDTNAHWLRLTHAERREHILNYIKSEIAWLDIGQDCD